MKAKLKIILLTIILFASIGTVNAVTSMQKPPHINAVYYEETASINEFSFSYWIKLFTWYNN